MNPITLEHLQTTLLQNEEEENSKMHCTTLPNPAVTPFHLTSLLSLIHTHAECVCVCARMVCWSKLGD